MPSEHPKQSSFITIFSVWNTMMGTSLLSMPWAVAQAGLGGAIVVMICMASLSFYTTYRVIQAPLILRAAKRGANVEKCESNKQSEIKADIDSSSSSSDASGDSSDRKPVLVDDSEPPFVEFLDVCADTLGPIGRWAAIIFSVVALVGALIVFWELMSKFAESLALFVYDASTGAIHAFLTNVELCATNLTTNHTHANATNQTSKIHDVLANHYTWPCALVALVFPLVSIPNAAFFQRFTVLGTVSVIYLMCYTLYNAIHWGINLDFKDKRSVHYDPLFKGSFISLTGVLSLSFFIQNCILTLLRHQRHPENNTRDLSISFALVAATYTITGVPFYVGFPLAKKCLGDNFLTNFLPSDGLATLTRAFLMLQYLTLYPLLAYITRAQLFEVFWPGQKHTFIRRFIFNTIVISICLLITLFIPNIGLILRYCGALSGLAYVFALPALVYMVGLHRVGQLTPFCIAVHVIIILLGIANVIAQFTLR